MICIPSTLYKFNVKKLLPLFPKTFLFIRDSHTMCLIPNEG